jgi:exodeoxyribonuclease III
VLTLASWNVNSLRARLDHVLRHVEAAAPDVLCLQETRVAEAAFPRARLEERGYAVAAAGGGGYAGVAIASRHPITDTVVGVPGFDEAGAPGRRLLVRTAGLWVDTVYVPTRTAIGKAAFLDALRLDYAGRLDAGTRLVLAGDFNICFDERDYASPSMITDVGLHTRRPEDLAWRRLLELGLVDLFRRRNAESGQYTWFPNARWALTRNYGMRLDYLFATAPIADAMVDCWHDREPRRWERPSDHLPVYARFDLA